MTKDKRSKIPQAIKREVRQRCCFGCVHCGNPIIEYHHIIPWNQVQTHEEDNLTILCSNCHKKVTNGLISCAQVIEWNNNPYNRNKIYSLLSISLAGISLIITEEIAVPKAAKVSKLIL